MCLLIIYFKLDSMRRTTLEAKVNDIKAPTNGTHLLLPASQPEGRRPHKLGLNFVLALVIFPSTLAPR